MEEFYKMTPGEYPKNIPDTNSDTKYVGDGWDIEIIDDSYILSYISGSLLGKEKSIEVSKKDFEKAKSGKTDLNKLLIKYDAY